MSSTVTFDTHIQETTNDCTKIVEMILRSFKTRESNILLQLLKPENQIIKIFDIFGKRSTSLIDVIKLIVDYYPFVIK
jgi:hypothetical protein